MDQEKFEKIHREKLISMSKIVRVIGEAHNLNGWEDGNFRGALAWMICADFEEEKLSYEKLDNFMRLTWKLYNHAKKGVENE